VDGWETLLLREQFVSDGFCLSEPLIDPDTIAGAMRAVDAVLAGRYETGTAPIYRNWSPGDMPRTLVKVDLPHTCDRTLQRLVGDTRIGRWAARVLDAEFVQLWACELIVKYPEPGSEADRSGVIGWHQDDRFWEHWTGEAFTVWLALVDIDERMGPVRYVAGSHKWGPQEQARFFFQTDLPAQRALIGTPAGFTWREFSATIPAGSASMHHRLTLHASGVNRTTLPRIGIAMHLRTERAHLVRTERPPFHTPDLIDYYACPVLTGTDHRKPTLGRR
jgi:Phytanoyl-CoA dioxygenase (PhyH)